VHLDTAPRRPSILDGYSTTSIEWTLAITEQPCNRLRKSASGNAGMLDLVAGHPASVNKGAGDFAGRERFAGGYR
jgi:hypothetical protein